MNYKYKDEIQLNNLNKLNEKTKGIPKFITDYFSFLSSNGTKLLYWSNIRQFLEWTINNNIVNNSLEKLTIEDFKSISDIDAINYFDSLLTGKDRISPDTVKNKKDSIKSFWEYLVERDCLSKNIITKSVTKKYKIESDIEINVPTEDEIDVLIGNIEQIKSEIIAIRNIAIVKAFTGSGIRLSELVGLDIEDLHFEKDIPEITIWAKGKKNSRNVKISKSAVAAINDYLKIRNSNENMKNLKPLFLSEQMDDNLVNKRMSTRAVQEFFKTYSNNSIHPHMLRDYFATKMYSLTKDIVWISKQLGHTDINITVKRYVKPDDNNVIGALDSF